MEGLCEDCTKCETRDQTGLYPAAYHGHDKCVEILITGGADVNKTCDWNLSPHVRYRSSTPLMAASYRGHQKCVDLLIQAGANVNKEDGGCRTALLYAAKNDSSQCLSLLLREGADVNAKDSWGMTALIEAAKNGHDKTVKIVIDSGADVNKQGCNALLEAVQFGHDKCVEMLIQAGVDVNQDNGGNTAIMNAYHEKCVDLLIKAGADVNKSNDCDLTPLMNSAFHGADKCVALLIKAGADVNKQDMHGRSPLICAAENSNPNNGKCIEVLVDSGADVNNLNSNGYSALMIASKYGHHKSVDCLLKSGAADKNSLMLAVGNGHPKCVDLLIRAGADVNRRDFNGKTPMMIAALKNHYNCVEHCLNGRCQINLLDNKGLNILTKYLLRVGNKFDRDQKVPMLLYAAGETIDETEAQVPDHLKPTELSLKHLCREAIRKHLLVIDPHQHLFYRVPRLGLPDGLSRYLVYNIEIDDPIEVNCQKVNTSEADVTAGTNTKICESPGRNMTVVTTAVINRAPPTKSVLSATTATDIDNVNFNSPDNRKDSDGCCCSIL